MRSITFLLFCLALSLTFNSCASRHAVPNEFRATLRERAGDGASANPATFVIVVDGFALTTYQRAMRSGLLPQLSRYFTAYKGEAVFPTLTYPNLSSIVTSSTPAQHPISANKILWQGEPRRFDHWKESGYLNPLLRGKTIFNHVAAGGGTSVSLSYVVSEGATVALKPDVKDWLAYDSDDYAYLDGKVADAFSELVDGPLPDFTFVHFIGVDAFSHIYGPEDPRVYEQLRMLDQALGRVFHKLKRLESEGLKIRVALTADHGFMTVKETADVDAILKRVCPGVTGFNQVRVETLYGNVTRACLTGLSRLGGIETVLTKNLSGFKGGLPVAVSTLTDRPTLQKLKDFFASASAPDAVILAKAGVGIGEHGSFGKGKHLGDHGGLTAEELEVPVLLHGDFPSALFNEAGLIPTYRLLKDDQAALLAGKGESESDPWQDLKIKFQFELPNSIVRHNSQYHDLTVQEAPRIFSSVFAPRLKGLADFVWSEHWSTRGYYSVFFSSYIPGSLAYHEWGAALRYRMHSGTALFGGFSSQQNAFRIGPRADQDWQKEWIHALRFGTQATLLSFGFGDLAVKGELGVLLPRTINSRLGNDVSVSTGFRQKTGLVFEHDLEARDSVSFELGVEHEAQNSGIEDRETLGWVFGAAYRLEL